MKVLLCIDNLGSGGAQRQIVALAVGLKSRGVEVHVFVYYPQDFFKAQLTENNIKVIIVNKKNRIGLNVLLKLRKLLTRENYDFAISYLITPNIYLTLAAWFSPIKTKIITSENAQSNIRPTAFFRLRYWCHKRAFAVMFNSVHEKNTWISHYNKLKINGITIYNGVDLELFSPAPVHNRTRRIIGVGTIGPHKNISVLIRAVKILKDAGESVKVHWYGKFIVNTPFYSNYHKEMIALITELGVEDSWTWNKPEKEINKVMTRYDCMVLPSMSEGLPNVVCESLACGVPVIVSNILDHPLLVEEGVRGYVFDLYDANDLAAKIRAFYKLSDDEYRLMQKNARMYAERELSVSQFIDQFINLMN
jgi:glycosyltransferase involved in cell wall biosynthesis